MNGNPSIPSVVVAAYHEQHTMLAADSNIDGSTVENGCLSVEPGSHKLGPIPDSSKGGSPMPLDQGPPKQAVAVRARAGDGLLFSYLTIHGLHVNHSFRPCRLLLAEMRSPLDRLTAQVHLLPGQGTMLRGSYPTGGIP